MVKSATEAARRYGEGIREFGGANTYTQCGQRRGQGFLAVAECLESASQENLTTESMIRRYRSAAQGGGGEMEFGG